MIIDINKKPYNVAPNEFNTIIHNEYNNLIIKEALGYFERVISLLTELSKTLDISECLLYNQTHGGFIPIQCAAQFESVFVLNSGDPNIAANIALHNVGNVSYEFPSKVMDYVGRCRRLIYAEKAEYIDHEIIKTLNPIILTSLDRKMCQNQSYTNILELTGTNLHLYIPNDLHDLFVNEFHYFIKGDKLDYDNMINLCIMVKNGGSQFADMLSKNMHLIDRWTILDTGSTDDTVNIIEGLLVGKKKGTLFKEPFINFRDSRNRLLDLAGTDCKYTLMLDDTYIIEGDLRGFLNEVRGDQFSDSFTLYIKSDDVEYGSNRILKTDRKLKYLYKIHEVVQSKNNMNVVIPITRAHIFDGRFDYMENRTMGRKELDLKLLYEELEEDPTNSRTHYYLGQTYNLLENYEAAYKWFIERMNHPTIGFIQEKIDAVFEAARIANFKLNKPWSECEPLYLAAYQLDPSRPDALYFLGIHYFLENNKVTAFAYFKKAFENGYPAHCQYSLKPTLSFHFLPKFLSQLCYEFEDFKMGEQCSRLFLEKNKPHDDQYDVISSWYQIFVNLNKMDNASSELIIKNNSNKPLLCFVADGGFGPWTGSDILVKGVGGSETYIIEMARHIQKSGHYNVIVFCKTPNEEHTVFEDVEYIHLNKFHHFIKNTFVDTCIISRFSEYIPVAIKGQAQNIHLVLHDLGPSGIVIPIHPKLKRIFCLSEWHVEYFLQSFPQFKDITVPFYYGIDTNKFNNERQIQDQMEDDIKSNIKMEIYESITKVPNKFIYSSFPNRGLYQLLQMWPKIVERFPDASLHIYSDINGHWVNSVAPLLMVKVRDLLEEYKQSEINNGNKLNIHYYGWVSKSELACAWLDSEYWFYPCTFMETFCLTAVEAALSKTLAISNGLAALQNTIGSRGICIEGDASTEEWQNRAVNALFEIMGPSNEAKNRKDELIEMNYNWASKMSWSNQANLLVDKYLLVNKPSVKQEVKQDVKQEVKQEVVAAVLLIGKNSIDTDNIDLYNPNNSNTNNKPFKVEKYYWYPNNSVTKMVENICITNKYKKILEIGPGTNYFKLATDFVGYNETITDCIDIDIDVTTLPFLKGHFDFLYCRHVMEDIQNPDFALNEIFRVSKLGYIETPSPLVEITKNIDASDSEKYCGYIHHRYIVWSNVQKNEIYFLPKYGSILDNLILSDETKHKIYNLINNYPVYWNNYILYNSQNKPNVIMYKNGVNMGKNGETLISDYVTLINRAINETIDNTNYFIQTYQHLI